jgi:hypothetical protein
VIPANSEFKTLVSRRPSLQMMADMIHFTKPKAQPSPITANEDSVQGLKFIYYNFIE